MTWHLDAAAVCALIGALAGLFVPGLIARLPEPEPDPESVPGLEPAPQHEHVPGEADVTLPAGPASAATGDQATGEEPPGPPGPVEPVVEEPKELYADLAALPGLRWKTAVASAVVAGLLGAAVGWTPALGLLLYLAPVGVALAVIDWRTRLLPTRVIAPSYLVVALLAVLAAALERDWHPLANAGWGWLVAGGTFFVLWFVYPRGMGYGDVRLSGVLGIALGYLGWAELLTGVYAGFLLGGVGGLLLSTLRIVDRKAYPFGPFMLVGAVLGVLLGPAVGAWYA